MKQNMSLDLIIYGQSILLLCTSFSAQKHTCIILFNLRFCSKERITCQKLNYTSQSELIHETKELAMSLKQNTMYGYSIFDIDGLLLRFNFLRKGILDIRLLELCEVREVAEILFPVLLTVLDFEIRRDYSEKRDISNISSLLCFLFPRTNETTIS